MLPSSHSRTVVLVGLAVVLHQVDGAHHHAGRAEAALQAVVLAEGLLHRVQLVAACARPSMVVTLAPSAWTASMVQDFTDLPSTWTTQAPHWLVSQPTCVPVRPQLLAQELDQQRARLDLARDGLAVHRH